MPPHVAAKRSTLPARRVQPASADRVPRYRQIADELVAEIGAGRFPVGGILPAEMILCRRYRVSRHTVREALRRLSDLGIISRRRRVGTEVVARVSPGSYRQSTNSVRDLLQYAEDAKLTILSRKRVTCDPALAALLESRAGRTWLRVHSLRRVPGNPGPISVTTAFVAAHFPDIDRHLDQLSGPISAMLERVYGVRIARIEQSIQAVRLGKRPARELGAESGSPALRAVRRYYDERGKLIELSDALHPGGRFSYETSLVRE